MCLHVVVDPEAPDVADESVLDDPESPEDSDVLVVDEDPEPSEVLLVPDAAQPSRSAHALSSPMLHASIRSSQRICSHACASLFVASAHRSEQFGSAQCSTHPMYAAQAPGPVVESADPLDVPVVVDVSVK